MLIYITKRLAAAVATLLLIMTITFFLMNTIPGSPFLTEKSTLSRSNWLTRNMVSTNL